MFAANKHQVHKRVAVWPCGQELHPVLLCFAAASPDKLGMRATQPRGGRQPASLTLLVATSGLRPRGSVTD